MKQMDVYITSSLPSKITAAVNAVESIYDVEAIPHGKYVDSGVGAQPFGRRETEKGARTRAANYEASFGDAIPQEGVLISLESGVFLSIRRMGFVHRVVGYAKDLETRKEAVEVSDDVRYPTRDIIRTLRKPGRFSQNTVGQSVTERLGGDHHDSLTQLGRRISRSFYLEQAAKRTLSQLRSM